MATYKLIQDIEAEDHILGPLTLRQFIFGLVASFFLYISFIVATKGAAFLLVVFLPPGLFCAFFAFPFGKDQPTEIWFLAKLRFWFLPRKRIWDQSGVKELVTITVPKKVERVLTDGLSQTEVKSRLQALANTIDSRGWAIKNVNVYAQPGAANGDSERLIDLSSLPQEVPGDDGTAADDILDTMNNPIAQQVDSMINQSAQAHHQRLVNELNTTPTAMPAPVNDNWFMSPSAAALAVPAVTPTQIAPPAASAAPAQSVPLVATETPADLELAKQLKQHAASQDMAYGHMRTMQPLSAQPAAPAPVPPSPTAPATTPSDPALLALSRNDDLNVSTLAREAHKATGDEPPQEVTISLR